MLSFLGFLLILAPLVIVHELGHFAFAKLFGVRADVFSIGFGKKIISWQWGETEFRWALIPFGGFVKLLGEDPQQPLSEEEKPRSLNAQSRSRKFWIFFGGPLFNFIWAVLVFSVILIIGEPQTSSLVGRVVQGSAAEEAGFRFGDRILSINGQKVKTLHEWIMVLSDKQKSDLLQIEVERKKENGFEKKMISVQPDYEEGYSLYGEKKSLPYIQGLHPFARSLMVGVSHPQSLAARSGVKTGDFLVSFNGRELNSWDEWVFEMQRIPRNQKNEIILESGSENKSKIKIQFQKMKDSFQPDLDLGLHSSELFIEKIAEGSPASLAGMQSGDRISTIGGVSVYSFDDLRAQIQKQSKISKAIEVQWERQGVKMASALKPTKTVSRDAALEEVEQYTIGVYPKLAYAQPEVVIERIWNPWVLLTTSIERTAVLTWRNAVTIGKIFTGSVSVGTLGGPVMIGRVAGESLERGLIAFLTTMALLSVGLGFLNLLPVPVLDGGHIFLLGLEAIRGKKLTLRQLEIIQQVGLSLVLLLMFVVLKNDLYRLFFWAEK